MPILHAEQDIEKEQESRKEHFLEVITPQTSAMWPHGWDCRSMITSGVISVDQSFLGIWRAFSLHLVGKNINREIQVYKKGLWQRMLIFTTYPWLYVHIQLPVNPNLAGFSWLILSIEFEWKKCKEIKSEHMSSFFCLLPPWVRENTPVRWLNFMKKTASISEFVLLT